ncbi:MAG: 4'-phosphopantetheinyl transferase superfamily protein [Bacilli bacterium]
MKNIEGIKYSIEKRNNETAHLQGIEILDKLLRNENICDYTIGYTNNLKPFIDNNKYISVSHTEEYVVCAVSDKNIGIDIIKIREKDDKVMKYFFSKDERNYVNSSEDSGKAFSYVWTLKEAFIKLNGDKLKDINNYNVIIDNKINIENASYYFIEDIKDYVICVIKSN